MVKQFYFSHRLDPIRYQNSRSEQIGSYDQRGTSHSSKLQDWSLTIRYRLVSYPGHLLIVVVVVVVGVTPLQRCSQHILQPQSVKWPMSNKRKISIFYGKMFNNVGCLICDTLRLFLLFENKRIRKSCVTNTQLEYHILFFSESWFLFSRRVLSGRINCVY